MRRTSRRCRSMAQASVSPPTKVVTPKGAPGLQRSRGQCGSAAHACMHASQARCERWPITAVVAPASAACTARSVSCTLLHSRKATGAAAGTACCTRVCVGLLGVATAGGAFKRPDRVELLTSRPRTMLNSMKILNRALCYALMPGKCRFRARVGLLSR